MDVDGGVELRTALVQVDDGLYGQGSRALCSVEGEVPPLAAGVLAFESEGAAEEHPEGAVRAELGERAVLQTRRTHSRAHFRHGWTFCMSREELQTLQMSRSMRYEKAP